MDDHLTIEERPALNFSRYAVVFHFVQAAGDGAAAAPPGSSDAFSSFERDLLSYAYRQRPPFASHLLPVPGHLRCLDIHYPSAITYLSEGLKIRLRCAGAHQETGRSRRVYLGASRTNFRSGLSVLHLVLSPADESDDAALNEYDLVKLAKLWEGGEGVGVESPLRLDRRVTFVSPEGQSLTIQDLAARVLGIRESVELQPRMGTIQLISADDIPGVAWPAVWAAMGALKEPASRDSASPIARLNEHDLHYRAVKGVAGILQGLLDFDRIELIELGDVFRSAHLTGDVLLAIHKGTLLSVAASDRALDAAPTIGVSPYLLAPQAVLAHNEECLRLATEASSRAASRLHKTLDHSRRSMQQALDRDFLPNLFHYPTERMLHDLGETTRGLRDQQQALRAALTEITAELEVRVSDRRRVAEDVLAGLLLIISGISLKDVMALWIVVPLLAVGALLYVYWRLST